MALKSTGYQATATAVAWTSGQDLNTLSDNEWTDLSDAINNSSNKYVLYDFELVLASAAFTGADSQVELYIVPSLDDTNYPNWTGNVATDEQENDQYFSGVTFVTSGATEAQRIVKRNVLVPPGYFKVGLRSLANVATAGSGNTLSYRPHSQEDV